MRGIRRSRSMVAIAVALLVLTAGAPAGAWTEKSNIGKTGFYEGPDENFLKGVVCRYDSDFDLVRMDIKPPQAHSYYNHNQRIGYRYIIERDTQPFDGVYEIHHRSTFIYDSANQLLPTDYPVRSFTDFPNTPSGNWRVRVVLKWVKPGTQTKQDGLVHGFVDAYKSVKGPNTHPSTGYCSESY